MTVFRAFSAFAATLANLADHLSNIAIRLQELTEVQSRATPPTERLELLELSRHQFEANCEGMLLRAEGKLGAAKNAEQRERQLKKSYAHLVDTVDEIGVEPETAERYPDSNHDAATSEEERVSALPLDVAVSPKALAQRAKFGVR